jgi:alkanesulfonate monooxygenase SsuD/methylene tetrahydromethanopterin reductase-like flavin-dependent oxidoreductase (luciferase family)
VPTFGILHDFRQPLPWSRAMAAYYAECVAEVEEAERLGFSAVWLSEHHGTRDGFLPAPLTVAAALAARTERIAIGTNVLVLPLHHPLRIAEDAAVLDLLAGGRLVLGVGQGYARHEFELFGADRASRASLLEAGSPRSAARGTRGPSRRRPRGGSRSSSARSPIGRWSARSGSATG